MSWCEVLKLHSAQCSSDMHPNQSLVAFEGYGLHAAPYRVPEPPIQIFSDRLVLRVEDYSAVPVSHSLRELLCNFCPRLAIQHLALGAFGRVRHVPCLPTPVSATGDGALAVAAPTHHSLPSSVRGARYPTRRLVSILVRSVNSILLLYLSAQACQ